MNAAAQKTFLPFSQLVRRVPLAEKGSPLTTKDLIKNQEIDAFFFRELEKQNIFLNKNQLEAVRIVEGPLLINAGAGSGKTSVIVSRVGYMLSVTKIDPRNILLVTFTKKAANEMKERIGTLPGITPQMQKQITAGTFHSVALDILRKNGCKKKIIHSERHQQYIIKMILKDLSIQETYEPESLLAVISYYKSHGLLPSEVKGRSQVEIEFLKIYQGYQEYNAKRNQMDFDDMLIDCYKLLIGNKELLTRYQRKFQYVICDEAQDTNPVQFKIVQLIAASQNLCLCGDTDQTIYGYRAAEIKFMLHFTKMYPAARIVTLDTNYRSTDCIVGLGNRVIEFNKNRMDKTLKTVKPTEKLPYFYRPSNLEEEADLVIRSIQRMVESGEKQYKDFAILYRTNSISRTIVESMIAKKIPFVFHGKVKTHFYQNSFVQPIIDLLRYSETKNINALTNISPILYLKREQVNQLLLSITIQEEIEQKDYPNKLEMVIHSLLKNLKAFQIEALKKKVKVINRLSEMSPMDAIQEIRKGVIAYDKYLEMNKKKTLTFHKEMIVEMLDEVEESARKFSTVYDYLAHIDSVIEYNENLNKIKEVEDYDGVQLMTIHASKGLEFDTVFLIGMIEDVLPHKTALNANHQEDRIRKGNNIDLAAEALEEERRLQYVAITRAKKELYISAPQYYHKKNKEVSRFLKEALEWQ